MQRPLIMLGRSVGAFAAALWLLASTAVAHQPSTVSIKVLKAPESGAADLSAVTKKGDTRVTLELRNDDPDYDVLVRWPACTFDQVSDGVLVDDLNAMLLGSGGTVTGRPAQHPNWSACIGKPGKTFGIFVVPRGSVVPVTMDIDFRRLGNQHIRIVAQAFVIDPQRDEEQQIPTALLTARKFDLRIAEEVLRRLRPASFPPLSMFYSVEQHPKRGPVFQLSDYKTLYYVGHPTVEELAEGLVTKPYIPSLDPVALSDFQTHRRVVPDDVNYDPNHSSLLNISLDTRGPIPGDEDCQEPQTHDCATYDCSGRTLSTGNPRAVPYAVSGRFSVKWTDHTLHPAFGWRAVAWWNNGGNWTQLAEDWVGYDGNYSLSFSHSGYSGQNLRMQFRAYNRYYTPMDEDDNTFRWKNPDRTGISTVHDEGHYYADSDGTNTNGLGEVYFRAYELWSEIYWRGGLNPLRANPIKLYYPNTLYDCGAGSRIPWSCASTAGTVWLIAAHGLQRDVVQHEFGHQVNNEFHNNKRPAGAGGSHTLTQCYNKGMGLREGYADFMPYWVQASRSTTPDTAISGYDIESPGNAYCQNTGELNEVWVAATFWDLHDSHSDGQDVLWFNSQGAAHAVYLNDPPANDGDALGMGDYRDNYSNAASAGHGIYIDSIFNQNDTD